MNRPWVIPAAVVAAIFLCACCLCLVVVAGLSTFMIVDSTTVSDVIIEYTPQPVITRQVVVPTSRPTRTPAPRQPSPTPPQGREPSPTLEDRPTQPPFQGDPGETLRSLDEALVPINDPADLAKRLLGEGDIPPTLPPPAGPRRVGDQDTFWVSDTDTNDYFQVDATLRYVTEHAYFWIENGVSYREGDLRDLADTFESKIYPTNREFFGMEWSPGVDGDVHLYILYAGGLGGSVAGYFSSSDSFNPQIQEYSNGHEMFVFNADGVDLREEFTYGVLAHEFQHMIHWYRDRNEATWMNEGFSDLAMFLNGYDIGGHDFVYALDPDIQLNDWPTDQGDTTPHYGASFLFVTYFLDRFGEDITKALVSHPDNDMISIDRVMSEQGITDPLTGHAIGADDIFADWVVATYLQNPRIDDGRYTYHNYPNAPQPFETETFETCGSAPQRRTVSQYGVDYIRINCRDSVTLRFKGSQQVNVLPADPHSGGYAFWSNKGDESDMTLTREFDFTGHSGPLTFTYWTWYDLEEDFDYLYLVASVDGENWEILEPPSGTADDPTGANYGWGYNAKSGNGPIWIQEEVDLSRFAGQKVQIRFEYITDAAVNGEGFLLDDVEIPEIGYSSDFENGDGGWQAAGFVRIHNQLPQTFRLSIIRDGRETVVEQFTLSGDNTAEIPLDLAGELDDAVLVVSGTTRYTRQPASYTLSFIP